MTDIPALSANEGGRDTSETISKTDKRLSIELVVAITLGALALAFFVGQELTIGAHTTATETFLFNCLQFVLTVGFAWFSTRTISRLEFEQSLKKFAISAYRRIADIDRMVDRLQREVRETISEAPSGGLPSLRAVDAMASDTAQLVRSSISDWGDVIGEELLAIERIKRLEHEKSLLQEEGSVKLNSEIDLVRKQLEKTIESIQSTLPPRLQLAADSEERTTRSARRMGLWIAKNHRLQNGLPVVIVTGDIYLSERARESLRPGEVLMTDKNKDGSLDVRDEHGLGVGRLTNPTPGEYGGFVKGFEYCYGEIPVSLEVVGLSGERISPSGQLFAWIDAKVVTQPLSRRPSSSPKS